jgi:VWFA-related protein
MEKAVATRPKHAWLIRIAWTLVAATAILAAQTPSIPQKPGQQPTFRATTEAVYTDVIVRDSRGQFIPDLRKDEFRVFEDGVEQVITLFMPVIGGRAMQADLAPAARPNDSGLILPPTRRRTDTSGRIFIVFIDDMHLQALDTPQVRRVLAQIRDELIHEGDLVGLVSTGFSSCEVNLSYDYNHLRYNECLNKVMGSAMTPQEIITMPNTAEGPAGLRYNAHVAFKTAYGMLSQAEEITGRRKSFLYVSSGYHFNPFKESRYKHLQQMYEDMGLISSERSAGSQENRGTNVEAHARTTLPVDNPFERNGQQFSEADLVSELAELIRAARRANVTFYTIDPRGLIATPPIHTNLSMEEWQEYATQTVSSLQVLGDESGGFCICNTNDFIKGLQRIDAETSDYYMLSYTSNNPDPTKLVRNIKIEVSRANVRDLIYRPVYRLKRPEKKGK